MLFERWARLTANPCDFHGESGHRTPAVRRIAMIAAQIKRHKRPEPCVALEFVERFWPVLARLAKDGVERLRQQIFLRAKVRIKTPGSQICRCHNRVHARSGVALLAKQPSRSAQYLFACVLLVSGGITHAANDITFVI